MKASPAPKRLDKRDAPIARRSRAVAEPTGKDAPSEPPSEVDPATQAAMERVQPAPGFALVKLLSPSDRESELKLPAKTVAHLEAAMVQVLDLHASDDVVARDYPPGSIVFLSLEGLAPLLGTFVFLAPVDRIQGAFPIEVLAAAPLGFEDANSH
jgi:hypothetical protein